MKKHIKDNAGNVVLTNPTFCIRNMRIRKGVIAKKIQVDSYIRLLQTLELYSYRVSLLWSGKRSNTGLSNAFINGLTAFF